MSTADDVVVSATEPVTLEPEVGCPMQAGMGPDGVNGPHGYQFLRQERREVGPPGKIVYRTEDVFFCTWCLKYTRKEVPDDYS